MSSETTIVVKEYDTVNVNYVLSDEERNYLLRLAGGQFNSGKSYRFRFVELQNKLRLETSSWVGVIQLNSLRIHIVPKFRRDFDDLIHMVTFVEKIPFYLEHDTNMKLGKSNFMELIVQLFLKELSHLWKKGLFKEYVEREENLRQVKGRPDVIRSLIVNLKNPAQIVCRYDELDFDVPENQVILAALNAIAKIKKLEHTTRKQVVQYRSEFNELCSPWTGKWPMFHYHRLNAHYQKIHKISRYLVEQMSEERLFQTSHQAFHSILIDMNDLFERFMATLLSQYLPNGYRVQVSKKIRDAIYSSRRESYQVIPDLLVTDLNGETLVLDVKYKNYGNKKVSNSDIYQLAFYSLYHHEPSNGKPHRSVIVHPQYYDQKHLDDRIIEVLPGKPNRGLIHVRSLSIEQVLEAWKNKDETLLREIALRLVKTD